MSLFVSARTSRNWFLKSSFSGLLMCFRNACFFFAVEGLELGSYPWSWHLPSIYCNGGYKWRYLTINDL